MASRLRSRLYLRTPYYAFLSIALSSFFFVAGWIVFTSTKDRGAGSVGTLKLIHKASENVLPTSCRQTRFPLDIRTKNQHGIWHCLRVTALFIIWMLRCKFVFANGVSSIHSFYCNWKEEVYMQLLDKENGADNYDLFHNRTIFLQDYKEMKNKFKIYVYPHKADDAFANIFLPVDFNPSGNYASESYFKKALMKSHLITHDPTKADFFFLPFSIARLRHDSRVNVHGIQDFIKEYISNISQKYPYWNRTNGADHFYVACHSAGRTAMDKVEHVQLNAIQVVCSSSYYVSSHVAHKDVSIPQIWPRQGNLVAPISVERKTLAFFAGAINSPVRTRLLEVWKDDPEIFVNFGRLSTPYSEALLQSKFCLHVKGFEVNTARIGDALYYGCVPVIIANYYDLPFNDIVNWKSFSLVVPTLDIPLLKDILHRISLKQYSELQKNVLEVRKHFQWHVPPVDYDTFNMVMYELWLRRHVLRIPL